MKKPLSSSGFTIIEEMIVLVIAAIIILIIFLAVPALQRNARNARRDHDAAILLQAIGECMINNGRNRLRCDSPAEISSYVGTLSIFSGYHYGSLNPPIDTISNGPTADEPNWLFNLKCNSQRNHVIITYVPTEYVVGYMKESSNGSDMPTCIDG